MAREWELELVEEGLLARRRSLVWSLLVEREVVVEFVGDPMGVEVVEESVGDREGDDPGEGNMPEPWIWPLSVFSIAT